MKLSKSEILDQVLLGDELFPMSPKDHHSNMMVIIVGTFTV